MNARFHLILVLFAISLALSGLAGLSSVPDAQAATPTIAIQRNSNGSAHTIYTPKPGGAAGAAYLRWTLTNLNKPALTYDLRGIEEISIRAFTPVDQSAATFVGSWGTNNGAAYYGGSSRYASLANNYAEFVLNVGANQRLSAIAIKAADAGIAYVTIDGQAALANLLPTDAQGRRLLDLYAASTVVYGAQRFETPIAEGLAPGTHTLRITVSGTKNAASAGTRIYIDGLGLYPLDASRLDSVEGEFFVVDKVQVGDTNDAYEYAYRLAANSRIYGTQAHGGESMLALNFLLDGAPVTLSNYQTLRGMALVVEESTQLGDADYPNLASILRRYAFTAAGLDLELRTTWNNPQALSNAFQGMFSLVEGQAVATWGYVDGYAAGPFSLTENNNQLKGLTNGALKGYGWNTLNDRVATLEITQPDTYLASHVMYIQDAAQDNKMYFRRQALNYLPGAGETWRVVNLYRVFSAADPLATATPAPTDIPLPTVTDTPAPATTDTPMPTATEAPTGTPTGAATSTATSTPLPVATDTPSPTTTDTPIPTTADTPVSTNTATPAATCTLTPVPTATETPEPASATPTPTATNTLAPVFTETPTLTATGAATLPPTDTPAAAATHTPTSTATDTPAPTATGTCSPTASSTPTLTPPPSSTPTPTSLPTLPPSATSAATATAIPPALLCTVQLSSDGAAYTFTTPKPGGAAGETLTWLVTNLGHTGYPFDLRSIRDGAVQVGDTNDAYEYGFRLASNNRTYGTQAHGGEILLSLALYVDGVQVELGRNQSLQGGELALVENTQLGDSDYPDLGAVRREYRFNAQGLDLDLVTTWNTSVSLTTAYQAMFAVVNGAAVSSMGYVDGYPGGPFSLTSDNGSIKGVAASFLAYEWNLSNSRVATLQVVGLDSYMNTYNLFIQDSAQDNKIYFLRQARNYTPAVGETWHTVSQYRVFNGSHP